MKTAFFLVPMLLVSAHSAHASDVTSRVLNHPVLLQVGKMLQDKHDDKCVLPEAGDVRFMCTGAMLPVKKPKLSVSGCAIVAKIICPNEMAIFSFSKSTIFLQTPKPLREQPASIEDLLSLENLEIRAN